jgi:hypothetical protein
MSVPPSPTPGRTSMHACLQHDGRGALVWPAPTPRQRPCLPAALPSSLPHTPFPPPPPPTATLAPPRLQPVEIEIRGGVQGFTWDHQPYLDLPVASTAGFVLYTLVKVRCHNAGTAVPPLHRRRLITRRPPALPLRVTEAVCCVWRARVGSLLRFRHALQRGLQGGAGAHHVVLDTKGMCPPRCHPCTCRCLSKTRRSSSGSQGSMQRRK